MAVAVILLPEAGFAHDLSRGAVREVDRRSARPAEVPERIREGRAGLRRSLGRQAVVATDPDTGGVRVAARLDGFLTRSAQGDPGRIALRYVREHADAFGLDADDLERLREVRRSTSPAGVTRIFWEQTSRGVPLHGAELRASVDRRGRIVNVLGAPLADAEIGSVEPQIDAARLMTLAHREAGSADRMRPRAASPGPRRRTRFAGGQTANLVLLADAGKLRLAWRLYLTPGAHALDEIRDARTGALLVRRDLVQDATALVWEDGPGPQTQQDISAYVTDGELCGTFACTISDFNDNGQVDAGEPIEPVDGNFEFPYGPQAVATGECPPAPAGCSWDHTTPFSWGANRRQSATQAHYFVSRAHDHMAAAPIGFDADDGAFEGATSVRVRAHNQIDLNTGLPTKVNNASMSTPGIGGAPSMRLHLYRAGGSGFRDVNAADHADTVYHEYTHGFNARLISDVNGIRALTGAQGDALDEAIADFFAMDKLVGAGLRTDGPASGELRMFDDVVLEHARSQARHAAIDCRVGAATPACPGTAEAGPGGFTYGDLGRVAGHPEAHADGEIWVQTMWDLRRRMIADHGAAAGLTRTRMLIAEGMRLAPPNPSMLDLRNAIVQVDAYNDGADRAALWAVFAARGMGWFASTLHADDLEPVESFALPPATGSVGTLSGVVTDLDAETALSNATVAIGGHNTTGLPSAREAFTGSDGGYQMTDVSTGTYPQVLVSGLGYDTAVARDVEVTTGGGALDVKLRRDFANVFGGAQVTQDEGFADCPASAALDEQANRGWSAESSVPRSFTVKLPQTVDVTGFAVHPKARCSGLDPTASVGGYRIEVSQTGVLFREAKAGTFTKEDNGGERLLPLAEPETEVNYVRFTALGNQGPHTYPVWRSHKTRVSLTSLSVHATVHDPPTASLTYAPRNPIKGDTVEFDAGGSTMEGGGLPRRFEWDLDGNGSFELTTGASPRTSRKFTETGRYYVRVRVTDDRGLTDERQRIVPVDSDVVISDLGTLGGDESYALSVNEAGLITGGSAPVGLSPTNAFLHDGEMRNRGTVNGDAQGNEINDAGTIVGWADPDGPGGDGSHAVRFDAGGPVNLDGRDGYDSLPLGINNAGSVVGWAEIDKPDAPGVKQRIAHSFSPLTKIDFALPGYETVHSEAFDVNASGDMVGEAIVVKDGQGRRAAVLQRGGQTIDLGGLGGAFAEARAMNDQGVIVGHAEDALGIEHAFVWDRGLLTDLGNLGGSETWAFDISEEGVVVGNSTVPGGALRAWVARDGVMTDLNDLLPNGSGWVLQSAEGINERNEIVGFGQFEGERRAFVLDLDGCDLCVEKLEIEERDLPGGEWKLVGHDGTTDGNLVRIKATVRNRGTDPLIANLKLRLDGDEIPGAAEPAALDPGETADFMTELETDGLAWKAGASNSDHVVHAALTLGSRVLHRRGVDLKVRPRPIIAVHGLNSDAATWKPYPAFAKAAHPDWEVYAVGDGRDGGFPRQVMDTGSLGSPLHRPNTVAQNAAVMAEYVRRVRERLEAAHVDVVAHSMGGLITRRYLHSLVPASTDTTPVVRHLVMLGSPLMGSPCADLFGIPSTYELRPDVVARFNDEVVDRKGTLFTNLVGDNRNFTCHSDEDGDDVVPISSARWTLPEVDLFPKPIAHTAMTGDQPSFSEYVLPRLNGAAQAPAPRLVVAPSAAQQPAPQLVAYEEPLVSGTLEIPLAVTGGSRLAGAIVAPDTVTVELLDPAGTVQATAAPGPVRPLSVDSPAPGAWKLRLSGSGEAVLSMSLAGGTRRIDLTGPSVEGNEVTVGAAVSESGQVITGADVSARFIGVDSDVERVLPMFDAGAGGSHAGTVERLPKGRYALLVEARKDGWSQATTTTVEIATDPPPLPPVSNGKIAFTRNATLEDADSDTREIFSVNPDGSGLADLTGAIPGDQKEPRFTSDGKRIHFDHDNSGIYVMRADGTQAHGVTRAGEGAAAYSPVADRLTYMATFLGECGGARYPCWRTAGPATARTDGRGARLFGQFQSSQSTWTADGTALVVTSLGPSSDHPEYVYPENPWTIHGLWSVRPDGYGWRQLTVDLPDASFCRYADEHADVSPDGRHILMSRRDCRPDADWKGREVAVLDTTTKQVTYLTDTEEVDEDYPAWSPDGKQIVYSARHQGELHEDGTVLMVMNADGSDPHKIADISDPYGFPAGSIDWQPLFVEEEPAVPVCTSAAVVVAHDAAAQLPLTCTDANGDALALSIVTAPAHGTLGDVDQAAGRVLYTPAAGYAGPDTVTFKAVATDGESAVATISITVGEGPKDPPPPDAVTEAPPIPAPTTPVKPPTTTTTPTGPFLPSGGGGFNGGGGGSGSGGNTCIGVCTPTIQCPTGARCDGDLSGRTGRGSRALTAAKRDLVKRVKFRIPGGGKKKLRIVLTAYGKKQLKRSKRLKVPVRLTLRQGTKVIRQDRTYIFRRR